VLYANAKGKTNAGQPQRIAATAVRIGPASARAAAANAAIGYRGSNHRHHPEVEDEEMRGDGLNAQATQRRGGNHDHLRKNRAALCDGPDEPGAGPIGPRAIPDPPPGGWQMQPVPRSRLIIEHEESAQISAAKGKAQTQPARSTAPIGGRFSAGMPETPSFAAVRSASKKAQDNKALPV